MQIIIDSAHYIHRDSSLANYDPIARIPGHKFTAPYLAPIGKFCYTKEDV